MKRVYKILGIVVILITGLAMAFVFLGLFVDEIEYTASTSVEAPVAATWATFMDEDRTSEWLTGFLYVEQISGGPNEVGARYRMHFVDDVIVEETVTKIVPLERYGFDLKTDFFTGSTTIEFVEVAGATEIDQTVSIRGTSFVWRALLPVFKSMMASQATAMLDSLGVLVEMNPTVVEIATPESTQPVSDENTAPEN